MLDLLRRFLHNNYKTLNIITISKAAILHNSSVLSDLNPKLQIAPVLKSNAYGHGIVEIAQILSGHPKGVRTNIPFLCVDSLYEAYQIMKAGVKTPVLIMGYTDPENFRVKKLPFQYAVYDLKTAEILNKYQKGSSIHIFVDTGMNREGIKLEDLSKFIRALKQLKNLKVVGLMSHLASAISIHDQLMIQQLKNFKQAKQIVEKESLDIKWFHLGGSSLVFSKPLITSMSKLINTVRMGRAIYGIGPHKNFNLKPAFTLYSTISQIKIIRKGDFIGYDGTFQASKNIKIAILPIGYFDGVDRRLSNKGMAKYKNKYCPIIGLVSMNMTTIDITYVKNPRVGDRVTIYSNTMADRNSVLEVSKIAKTTPSEILSSIVTTTKRVIVD